MLFKIIATTVLHSDYSKHYRVCLIQSAKDLNYIKKYASMSRCFSLRVKDIFTREPTPPKKSCFLY